MSVSVDNGYTEMLCKSLFVSVSPTYEHTSSRLAVPWSMMDYCGRLSLVLLPVQP